jgi:hypothetical protein
MSTTMVQDVGFKTCGISRIYMNFLTSVASSLSSSSIFERANSHTTQRVEPWTEFFITLLFIVFLCFWGSGCGISLLTEKNEQFQFSWGGE